MAGVVDLSLYAEWREWSICHFFCRALLLVPGQLQLMEMEWDYCGGLQVPALFASEDMPSFVAIGMALDRFPKLRALDFLKWYFLVASDNWSYVNTAITLGKLPNVVDLALHAGNAVDVIADALQTRVQLQESNIICDSASALFDDGETMDAFMKEVLASGHQRVALKDFELELPNDFDDAEEVEIYEPDKDSLDASRTFIAALKGGVFPKLQCLVVRGFRRR